MKQTAVKIIVCFHYYWLSIFWTKGKDSLALSFGYKLIKGLNPNFLITSHISHLILGEQYELFFFSATQADPTALKDQIQFQHCIAKHVRSHEKYRAASSDEEKSSQRYKT